MIPLPETMLSSVNHSGNDTSKTKKNPYYTNAYSAAMKVLNLIPKSSANSTMATSALCSTSKAFFDQETVAMDIDVDEDNDDGQLFNLFRRPTDWATSIGSRRPSSVQSTTVSNGTLDPPLTGHGSSRVLSMAVVRLEQEDNQSTNEPKEDDDECETISALTQIVLGKQEKPLNSIEEAHELFRQLGRSIPRRVCQHPFKKNDIVWVCRTCQSDETCVLCHQCFTNSNHEGHDVAFYHAQAGGCCDCGDPDAWDPAGFCPLHGGSKFEDTDALEPELVQRVGGAVQAVAEFLVSELVINVTNGFERVSVPSLQQRKHQMLSRNQNISSGTSESDHYSNNSNNISDLQRAYTVDTMDVNEESDTNDIRNNISMENVASVQNNELSLLDELTFDPRAASTSKSRHKKRPSSSNNDTNFNNDEKIDKTYNNGQKENQHFDPEAASTSKSLSSPHVRGRKEPHASPAQLLGQLGSEQDGLYIVLHADDIHHPSDITVALKDLYTSKQQHGLNNSYNPHTEAILNKIARLLKQRGNLVVWGTHECISELGPTVAKCWKDGDRLACTRIGAYILEKARALHRNYNLVVSVQTRHELLMEKRAQCVLTWLNVLSQSCDPLCHQVSIAIHDEQKYLIPLLRADLKLPRHVTHVWHGLLLTLLAVPSFKAHLANAYADTYRQVTAEYARGLGILDKSLYTLSVQFLNRVTYVQDLVKERNLLDILSTSLLETLRVAVVKDDMNQHHQQLRNSDQQYYNPWDDFLNLYVPVNDTTTRPNRRRLQISSQSTNTYKSLSLVPTLNPMHPVLSHRRYSPCISDLKCVLNVQGMARLFASLPAIPNENDQHHESCLDGWIKSLSLGQFMDPQIWRSWSEEHVETEPRGWVGAFNASISLGSLFERLLSWEGKFFPNISSHEF